MKFQFDRQAYLKGLLLLVLAANASWDFSSNPLIAMNRVHTMDLAQTAPPSEVVHNKQQSITGSVTGSAVTTGAQVATIHDAGPRPDAPVGANGPQVAKLTAPGDVTVVPVVPPKSKLDIVEMCNARYEVTHFENIAADGHKQIKTSVHRMSLDPNTHAPQSQAILTIPFDHPFDEVFGDNAASTLHDNYVAQVKDDIKELDCPDKVAKSDNKKTKHSKDDSDKKENCRNSDDEVQCNIDALDDLDCDKKEVSTCRQSESEASSIVARVKKLLKKDLESDDEDVRTEAQDKMADLQDSLKDLGKEKGINVAKISKLSKGVDAFVDASLARGDIDSRDYLNRSNELRDHSLQAARDCAYARKQRSSDAMSICQDALSAQKDAMSFGQELKDDFVNQDYVRQLYGLRQSNDISSSDYNDFLSPYGTVISNLKKAIEGDITGSGASRSSVFDLSGVNPPSDLLAARSALTLNLPAGVSAARSNTSLGNFGLSTSVANIGPNPFSGGGGFSGATSLQRPSIAGGVPTLNGQSQSPFVNSQFGQRNPLLGQ